MSEPTWFQALSTTQHFSRVAASRAGRFNTFSLDIFQGRHNRPSFSEKGAN